MIRTLIYIAFVIAVFVAFAFIVRRAAKREVQLSVENEQDIARERAAFAAQWNRVHRSRLTFNPRVRGEG